MVSLVTMSWHVTGLKLTSTTTSFSAQVPEEALGVSLEAGGEALLGVSLEAEGDALLCSLDDGLLGEELLGEELDGEELDGEELDGLEEELDGELEELLLLEGRLGCEWLLDELQLPNASGSQRATPSLMSISTQ